MDLNSTVSALFLLQWSELDHETALTTEQEQCKWHGGEVWKMGIFWPIFRFISKTRQDTAIVTMEDDVSSTIYRNGHYACSPFLAVRLVLQLATAAVTTSSTDVYKYQIKMLLTVKVWYQSISLGICTRQNVEFVISNGLQKTNYFLINYNFLLFPLHQLQLILHRRRRFINHLLTYLLTYCQRDIRSFTATLCVL